MNTQLETIPIQDSFKEECECPLCYLEQKAEKKLTGYYLGSSVMTPEVRVQVNKSGFCPDHFAVMMADQSGSKHGLGLMTHTHLQEQNRAYEKIWTELQSAVNKSRSKKISSKKKDPLTEKLNANLALLREKEAECLICRDKANLMTRYIFTIVYLWKNEMDFRQTYRQSRGFCLHHLPPVLEAAQKHLPRKLFVDFTEMTVEIEKAALQRLESEVLWYTNKFDPQNDDKPWGTSKDALMRTIWKLTGRKTEG